MRVSIQLDTLSSAIIQQIAGTPERLEVELEKGLDEISKGMLDMIPSRMAWANPRPVLAGSFSITKERLYREIGSREPHARRRDKGFKGQDSLGRVFKHDRGAHYMKATVNAYSLDFVERMGEAVDKAISPI